MPFHVWTRWLTKFWKGLSDMEEQLTNSNSPLTIKKGTALSLPKGYKNTEVGNIPEGWVVREFGEICYPSKSRMNPITSDSNYKCIELEHLSQGSGFLLGYANSKDLKSQKSFFEEGDVLFGKLRPYLRKFYFADFKGVCTTEIWVLKTERETSNRFLFHLVQSDKIVEAANLSTGTKMPRAEWKTVSETKIPVPTKAEQTAIANALGDADALIKSLEKLITKKRNIKQGAMQKLLKPKEGDALSLSKGWEVKKLGDVATIVRGASPRPIEDPKWFDENSLIGWVRISDVTKSVKILTETTQKLSELGVQSSRYVEEGNLIMSICATVGRPILTRINVCIHDGFVVFRNPQIEINYLYYFLSFIEKDWSKNGQTGSQMNLNTTLINTTEIPIPPTKEEQTHIATILSDMDAEMQTLETKLEKYRNIKLGMMQNLLTGKIRLV